MAVMSPSSVHISNFADVRALVMMREPSGLRSMLLKLPDHSLNEGSRDEIAS